MNKARLSSLLGISTLRAAPRDVHLLYLSRFLRTAAFGSTGVILAVFLSGLGHSDVRVGLFMTLTLVGDVFLSLILTNWADHFGRRRTTILGCSLMITSGLVFAIASNYWILLAAAVLGVISPSGNEIGPFRAVEEGMLASLSANYDMSDIFAWHIVAGTLGVSFGTFSTGWITAAFQKLAGWTEQESYRVIFIVYAIIGLTKLLVALKLSNASEVERQTAERQQDPEQEEAQPMLQSEETSVAKGPGPTALMRVVRIFVPELTAPTRSILWRLCLLFAIDSFASGMVAL